MGEIGQVSTLVLDVHIGPSVKEQGRILLNKTPSAQAILGYALPEGANFTKGPGTT